MQTFRELVQAAQDGSYKPPIVSYDQKKIDPFRYDLAVTKFQLGIASKGMIPYRGWKLKPIKSFYELKGGSAKKCFENFMEQYGSFI